MLEGKDQTGIVLSPRCSSSEPVTAEPRKAFPHEPNGTGVDEKVFVYCDHDMGGGK